MILRDFTLSLSSARKVSSAQNISKIRFSLAMKLDGAPLQFGTRTGTLHQRHLIWLSHHLSVWICNSICISICFCAHLISLESLRQRHQPIHRPSQFLTEKYLSDLPKFPADEGKSSWMSSKRNGSNKTLRSSELYGAVLSQWYLSEPWAASPPWSLIIHNCLSSQRSV